jgi:F-type H+-transporting ATPase subunit delta
MAEKITIARPYAKALFELAFEHKQLQPWLDVLAVAAAVAEDAGIQRLLVSPHLTTTQHGDLFIEILEQALGRRGGLDAGIAEAVRNFVRTSAANRRLALLPEIFTLFARMKAESENTMDVTVRSAVPLDDALQSQYAGALRRRLKREVRVKGEVDPSLLGGAVLQADDLVIDGSLRGRLERLDAELTA